MFFQKRAYKTMVPKKIMFDGVVKKMDIRGGEDGIFLWLKEKGTEREFTSNFKKLELRVDLPRSFLEETIHFMEGRQKREAPLSELLDNMADVTREFKFVRLARGLRFEVKSTGDDAILIKVSVPSLPSPPDE